MTINNVAVKLWHLGGLFEPGYVLSAAYSMAAILFTYLYHAHESVMFGVRILELHGVSWWVSIGICLTCAITLARQWDVGYLPQIIIYTVATIPVVIYAVVVLMATLSGTLQQTGLLGAFYLIVIAAQAITGYRMSLGLLTYKQQAERHAKQREALLEHELREVAMMKRVLTELFAHLRQPGGAGE